MKLRHLALATLLSEAVAAPTLAESWTCVFDQDCEMGQQCIALSPPRNAWLSADAGGGYSLELDGQVAAIAEAGRFENALSFAGTPSPNNVILLTVHLEGEAALTVHYTSPTAFFANTMRGTCTKEPG